MSFLPRIKCGINSSRNPVINRLLKEASTALITQIRKNDYTDISMGFNL